MAQPDNPLLSRLQLLQDLKFLIDRGSGHRLDYHRFRIFEIRLPAGAIDLVAEYQHYAGERTLDEIAQLIVQKYQL
ncbi:hypothetical protein [Levilactobacillus yiduensis]|uniref:hypothetical protein n=1 Tax=Levilactobacillus yiduensis TaxID=2953880 RepID=UPI000EF2F854|nr:hypothetical protein [Levilactobacillus yiduensis]AYM02672.1 hypothetical protein D8911_06545 [Levilactobacillus brevis]